MGRRIYQCASGDFTGDGYPDLIGLDISGEFPVAAPHPWSELRLIRNNYPVNLGATPLFHVDMATSYDKFYNHTGPASITVGDYNGDGLLDFFFMRNSSDQFGYTNFLAAMYINAGTAAAPDFRPYNVSPNLDFTVRFQAANIYIFWAANHLFSIDIDHDGDVDILAISQDKVFLLRNPGAGNFNLAAWSVSELSYDARTGFAGAPGGSAVAAADFDGDGDDDIVCGTVGTAAYLVYYENDGTGHFSRNRTGHPRRDLRRRGRHHGQRLYRRRAARHLRGHGLCLRERPPGPHLVPAKPRRRRRRCRLEVPVPQRLYAAHATPLRHRHVDAA